jgi:2-dehydropantoate 2-reductase
MRVLVVGAGAVGGYFGGRLLQAGGDVTFLVRPRRAAQLATNGFVIRSSALHVEIPNVRAILSEQIEATFDLVLLSCKAYDLPSAMTDFAPAVGPDTTILPVLNGMRHIDLLAEQFNAARVIGGLCAISAALDQQGHVMLLGRTPSLVFGELDGSCSTRVDAIAARMQGAAFDVRASDTIVLDMWEKWVLLATLAGMTCLMRGTVGDIVAAGGSNLTERLLEECHRIAMSQGQVLRPENVARTRSTLTQAGSTFTASMLRDLEGGAATEVEHVLGDLMRRQSDDAASEYSLLRIAYVHLKTCEARRAR